MALTAVAVCNMSLGRLGHTQITTLTDTTPPAAKLAAEQCTLFYEQTRDSLLRSHTWRFATVWANLAVDSATVSGTSTGTGNTTLLLYDTGKSWTPDAYNTNYYLWITGGTGSGQIRDIADTAATYLTVTNAFTTVPDSTSTYEVWQYYPPTPYDYRYSLPSDCLRIVKTSVADEGYELTGPRLKSDDDNVYVKYVQQITDPALFDPLFVEVLVLSLAAKLCRPLMLDKVMIPQLNAELTAALAQARLVNLVETSRVDHDETWNEARA